MDMEYYKETMVAVMREFSRFRALCALLFAVVLIGVVCAGIFWPRAYQSDALIYIDSVNVIEPLLEGRAEVSNADRAEQAQKLLYTRSLLRTAAESVGMLDESATPEFENVIITKLRNNLSIEAESQNYFRVGYWGSSPDHSFEVLDAVIKTFIGGRAAARQSESTEAYGFINSQVKLYKKQLDEAERKLEEHRSKSPNTTPEAINARIANLTTTIQDLEISVQETESKIATTEQLLGEEDQYLNEQTELSILQARRRELRTELSQLRVAYQESYPDIVSLKAQLQDVESALGAMEALQQFEGSTGKTGEALFDELRQQLSVAEVNIKAQKSRLRALKNLLQKESKRADLVAENQAHLEELTRDYNVIVDVYEELLSRQENAKLSMALNMKSGGEGYQIVEEPVYPLDPGGPTFIQFAMAAPVLGLGAPFGLLLAFIMVDPRKRSSTSLLQAVPVEIELMGVIPNFRSPSEMRAARIEIALLIVFCTLVLIGYGFLVYAGVMGLV